MESPAEQTQAVERYLASQSGEHFRIEHVEKIASDYVAGRQHDVWDAHTNEGRWWVITNPTNLYSQDAIKSMDVALSFHIGLMQRVFARTPPRQVGTTDDWVLDLLRRTDLASERFDTATEVEDFQAVGMRLREALVSLAAGLKTVIDGQHDQDPPKGADFRGWANLATDVLAAGADNVQLRGLMKAQTSGSSAYPAP